MTGAAPSLPSTSSTGKGGDRGSRLSDWLTAPLWHAVVGLSQTIPFFKTLPEEIGRNADLFQRWFHHPEPESQTIPVFEQQLQLNDGSNLGNFYRFLFIRTFREDRMLTAAMDFIRSTEFIESNAMAAKLPVMGNKFVQPQTDTIEMIYNEVNKDIPVIYLLSPGADPTETIEIFAKKRKKEITSLSMGEGQETLAYKAINNAALNGTWVLLQVRVCVCILVLGIIIVLMYMNVYM